MINQNALKYQRQIPTGFLADLVSSFWTLENTADEDQIVTVLPDGYFDILFNSANGKPFKGMLIGLSSRPQEYIMEGRSVTFSISLKLTAAEFILKKTIRHLRDTYEYLPQDSAWYNCLNKPSLEIFVNAVTDFMYGLLDHPINEKKLQLFNNIYRTNGDVSINKLSASIHWSSRQINRYFQEYFGLSLKTYCSILRFRATFEQLHNGKLFPPNNYYDQAHFIREVNKFSKTTPRHLAKNADDRFIQLATLNAS
ncbi:DUF6597 domain-containing transcriptional factor [Mucilaginibacter sp. 3215]|uniref:DUF6597 domain-containing transcriptional factor n=1 Tax=Mucilaginibacter sp. 3215 TaxID=3373912 RepID=UPI003D1DF8FC